MTHQVELPADIYRELTREAREEGVTLAEWIAARLWRPDAPKPAHEAGEPDKRLLKEVLQGLVGSFDSSAEQFGDRRISAMAEIVADKLQRQGIEVPWRRQR